MKLCSNVSSSWRRRRRVCVESCTFGVASGFKLICITEVLLFYVGAVLIARGTYTYLQMLEVLNLVVFMVSIGSQLMAFSTSFFYNSHSSLIIPFIAQRIAKLGSFTPSVPIPPFSKT